MSEIDQFIYEIGQDDREIEINRILKSFILDPYQILGISYDSTNKDINKLYRKKSLLCHPDKCTIELRPRAEKAFDRLRQAKTDLLDEEKRPIYSSIYTKCRDKIIKQRELDNMKYLKEYKLKYPNVNDDDIPKMKYDVSLENAIRDEMKEELTAAEWRRRQFLKQQAEEEGKKESERERKEKEFVEKRKFEEEWEKTRERRVNSWRDFKSKSKHKKKKKRRLETKKSKDAI